MGKAAQPAVKAEPKDFAELKADCQRRRKSLLDHVLGKRTILFGAGVGNRRGPGYVDALVVSRYLASLGEYTLSQELSDSLLQMTTLQEANELAIGLLSKVEAMCADRLGESDDDAPPKTYERKNDLFRDWHESEGIGPADILSKWNALTQVERTKLVPDDPNRIVATKGKDKTAARNAIGRAIKYKPKRSAK